MTTHLPCLEVAVVSVKDANSFTELQKQAHRDLAQRPGFVRSVALRGLDDPALRADLIVWASEDAAQAASESMKGDARFAPFMEGIDALRHFAHYDGATEETLKRLVQSPVVEIAAYTVKPDVPMLETQAQLHTVLDAMDGSFPQLAGNRDDGASLLDLIGWDSKERQTSAPKRIVAKHPSLATFFDGVDELIVLELFEVLA